MSNISNVNEKLQRLIAEASEISKETEALQYKMEQASTIDPFIFSVTVFVLACFIGYYVVWKVTPALHTPLMSVTNAISGIIIVGAIISLGPDTSHGFGRFLGFIAVVIASINIFGGFMVSKRMLDMYKKKDGGK